MKTTLSLNCRQPIPGTQLSASLVSIVGGGTVLRLGEISVAHHGVLFLDELPEYNRSTIEALRQTLEDRRIALARPSDRI